MRAVVGHRCALIRGTPNLVAIPNHIRAASSAEMKVVISVHTRSRSTSSGGAMTVKCVVALVKPVYST